MEGWRIINPSEYSKYHWTAASHNSINLFSRWPYDWGRTHRTGSSLLHDVWGPSWHQGVKTTQNLEAAFIWRFIHLCVCDCSQRLPGIWPGLPEHPHGPLHPHWSPHQHWPLHVAWASSQHGNYVAKATRQRQRCRCCIFFKISFQKSCSISSDIFFSNKSLSYALESLRVKGKGIQLYLLKEGE